MSALHQNSPKGDPMGAGFDYAEEFESLDLDAVKRDIDAVMTTSQEWWPADFGHYGPLFIRMAWHSGRHLPHQRRPGRRRGRAAAFCAAEQLAGQRQPRQGAPPAVAGQAEYGRKISWADLMILAGNCALESNGLETFGSPAGARTSGARGRQLGSEATWLGDERYSGDRSWPTRSDAVQMGLIYVNPQAQRQPRPACRRARHPRDVPAHGDERRETAR